MDRLNTTPDAPALGLGKSFWVIWAIELWERFGYYGVQAILALYFVQQLGYSEAKSFYVFGSFSALAYGFVWVGGWLGDRYLGPKRTLVLGAIILMLSYLGLGLASHDTIFYPLSGIIVGSCLFKANPSSLISKLFIRDNAKLDSAMTLYYMAVNVGSMISMALTPVIAQAYGWSVAFWVCALGLLLGLVNYFIYRRALDSISIEIECRGLSVVRYSIVVLGSLAAIGLIAQLLDHTVLCNWIVYCVVTLVLTYFLKIAFSLEKIARARMFVAFVLILQAVLFFVLYNQMPTSLTFFALHNVNSHVFGLAISAAEYQVLNPIIIVIMSPIMAWGYYRWPSTHVTKFCVGMSLCALAFLVLTIPAHIGKGEMASPLFMVFTYFLQSTGELLISGLGLAMVAALCPRHMSGFVMGAWGLALMLAGPIGAWVGALTAPAFAQKNISALMSMSIYTHVFFNIGAVTGFISLIMWILRPTLNKYLNINEK